MKILVVSNYLLYQDLSCSFVHNQAKAYVSLGNDVLTVIPIAISRRNYQHSKIFRFTQTEEDGVRLCFMPYLSLSNFGDRCFNQKSVLAAAQMYVSKIDSFFHPDVIHAHFLSSTGPFGAFLKEKFHCPLILTTHGSDTSIPVEQGRAGELKPLCDAADRVVAVSSALADKLRTCGTGTPISVILNGFQSRLLSGDTPKIPLSFIQVGHLLEQKRFHVTIRAFAAIRTRHPEATLTIIGQGPEREALEGLCRELGVAGSVRFLGQVPNETVLAEMAKHRFFVMPSVREGFGIVYLEAMAGGCVTIGTEGEGIADLIVSGENGFLVPPDDPEAIVGIVERCLENPDAAEAIAERGRQDARSLTWERNARQYIKLFEEVCS